MTQQVEEIAEGDTGVTVEGTEFADETGQLARALDLQFAHVRQRLTLRVARITQQRGGGAVRGFQVLGVEACQRRHLQLFAQQPGAQGGVELPLGTRRARSRRLRHAAGSVRWIWEGSTSDRSWRASAV